VVGSEVIARRGPVVAVRATHGDSVFYGAACKACASSLPYSKGILVERLVLEWVRQHECGQRAAA